MRKLNNIYKALSTVSATQLKVQQLVIIIITIDHCNNVIMKLVHIAFPSVYPILISTTTIQLIFQPVSLITLDTSPSVLSHSQQILFVLLPRDLLHLSTFSPFLYKAIL